MLTAKYKLKNNFEVSKLMKEIDIDFIYSETDDRFLLLNQDMYGEISHTVVGQQKSNKDSRIAIINNKNMMMEVFNIPVEEMDEAIVKV